jgi:hypothetical protein
VRKAALRLLLSSFGCPLSLFGRYEFDAHSFAGRILKDAARLYARANGVSCDSGPAAQSGPLLAAAQPRGDEQ